MDVQAAHAAIPLAARPRVRPAAAAAALTLVPDNHEIVDEPSIGRSPPVTGPRRGGTDAADASQCSAWFERAARGDIGAFEALYRHLHAPLRQFAEGYVRSRDVAEEIVQDVFLAVWEGRETFRLRGSIKGYLYVAVRNRALNQLKRWQAEHRSTDRLAREDQEPASHDPVVERLTREELVAAVRRVVEELPPRTREAYRLYYEHELPYAEIAAVMGTAVKTVENQLARALRHLYGALGKAAR